MKVWIVSQGCYSAVEIIGAFSTEEAANETVDALLAPYDPRNPDNYSEEYRIEVLDVDERPWPVRYWAEVAVINGNAGTPTTFGLAEGRHNPPPRERWREHYSSRPPGRAVHLTISGRTRDEAAKAARDLGYQYAAQWDMRVAAAKEAGMIRSEDEDY